MEPGRIISGAAREIARRAVANPVVRSRRVVLIVKLRVLAWLTRSTVDVQIDKTVRVGRRVIVQYGGRGHNVIRIGKDSKIGDAVRFRLYGGRIDLGQKVDVRSNAVLSIDKGELVLDGPNNLGWGVTIHCAESIHLARFAHVAEYSTIVDNSHFYTEEDVWSYHNTRTAPIVLEQDVWVCPKATITSGVTIGDHTIVASNTVVVKDVPSGVLISGVPGKIIRELDLPWKAQ